MSRPAIVTVSMLLNHTTWSSSDLHVARYTKPQPSTLLLLFHGSMVVLKVVRLTILLYPLLIVALMCRPIQRRFLYGHKSFSLGRATSSSSKTFMTNPETLGFLRNQITHHSISTPDGETLSCWLVVPLGAYAKHESIFSKRWTADENQAIALQCVRDDPKAILAVYMHGSGHNIATQRQCDAYRNLSGVSPDHIYLLAFDYRGFGGSSGSPTEEGLIVDAVSVLSWAEKTLNIPRKRTLLIGHSMGAAVVVAAALRVIETYRYAEYAGIILCSAFTELSRVVVNIRLVGVPILKPLLWSKHGRRWLEQRMLTDSWTNEQRVKDLIKGSEVLRLTLIHAINDDKIPQYMSDLLYDNCRQILAPVDCSMDTEIDQGALGVVREVKSGRKSVREVALRNGGHNMYTNWHTLSFEVARILTMAGAAR